MAVARGNAKMACLSRKCETLNVKCESTRVFIQGVQIRMCQKESKITLSVIELRIGWYDLNCEILCALFTIQKY
jgi:hypothetical protein